MENKINSKSPTPETDMLEYEQECNFDVSWEDHSRKLEIQRDILRKTLEKVLSSASPHPKENQSMHEAWKEARMILAQNQSS